MVTSVHCCCVSTTAVPSSKKKRTLSERSSFTVVKKAVFMCGTGGVEVDPSDFLSFIPLFLLVFLLLLLFSLSLDICREPITCLLSHPLTLYHALALEGQQWRLFLPSRPSPTGLTDQECLCL